MRCSAPRPDSPVQRRPTSTVVRPVARLCLCSLTSQYSERCQTSPSREGEPPETPHDKSSRPLVLRCQPSQKQDQQRRRDGRDGGAPESTDVKSKTRARWIACSARLLNSTGGRISAARADSLCSCKTSASAEAAQCSRARPRHTRCPSSGGRMYGTTPARRLNRTSSVQHQDESRRCASSW